MRTLTLMSILLCLTRTGLAQSVPAEQDVNAALKDAEYALRRFEEVAARVDFSRWHVPKDLLLKESEALKSAQGSAEEAKSIPTKLDGSRKPTSTELLDITFDLGMVGGELSDLSYNTLNFQDESTSDIAKASESSELGTDLARAGATTQLAEARIFVILRRRIVVEERLLKKCAQSTNDP